MRLLKDSSMDSRTLMQIVSTKFGILRFIKMYSNTKDNKGYAMSTRIGEELELKGEKSIKGRFN